MSETPKPTKTIVKVKPKELTPEELEAKAEAQALRKWIRKNPKQELFCNLYTSDNELFGNGVQSYAEAFDRDLSKPGQYSVVASQASVLLKNPNVLRRIDQLLALGPLSDAVVDKQLAFVIAQNAELPAKVSAIKEYNKMRGRITDKSVRINVNVPPILGGKARVAHDAGRKEAE